MTHDYKRNGTTTLFAALDTLKGRVVGECHSRHRHQEFLKFLRRLDREFPGKVPLHVVMDNYGTHKHKKVREWLKRHPRFVPHFVPTSSSWLNLVERWFGHLDSKAIRRGVHSFSFDRALVGGRNTRGIRTAGAALKFARTEAARYRLSISDNMAAKALRICSGVSTSNKRGETGFSVFSS